MSPQTIPITQWLLDTRPLWPVTSSAKPKEQMQEFTPLASHALSLLPPADRSAVLRYHHVRDAKMSLASHLLKRLAIAKLLSVPWSAATISRDENGKPIYLPSDGSESKAQKTIEFNVSHQAGIVVLVACVYDTSQEPIQLGTDIVCVNERNDYARVDEKGFFSFLSMHSDVFSPLETQALQFDISYLPLRVPQDVDLAGYARDAIVRCQRTTQPVTFKDRNGTTHVLEGKRVIEAKLRRFYALWCLREAYVKMTGEALLAEWLRELEFRGFRTPAAAAAAATGVGEEGVGSRGNVGSGLEVGEVVTELEIYFKRKRVSDVVMELKALGLDYMVATAARVRNGKGDLADVELGRFVELEIEKDVLAVAEAG